MDTILHCHQHWITGHNHIDQNETLVISMDNDGADKKKKSGREREREGTIKRIRSNNKKNIFDSSVHHCGNLNKHWCSSICLVVPDRTKQTGARTHHSNTRLLLQHLDNSAFVPQTTTTTAATTTISKLVTCTRRTTIYL